MTMRVNLIYSELVFFKKNVQKLNTPKKTVHANSASELHYWRAQCK